MENLETTAPSDVGGGGGGGGGGERMEITPHQPNLSSSSVPPLQNNNNNNLPAAGSTTTAGNPGNTASSSSNPPAPASSSSAHGMIVESPPLVLRDPTTRPVYKLSVKLIDTYKYINKVRETPIPLPSFALNPLLLLLLVLFPTPGILRSKSTSITRTKRFRSWWSS